MVSISYQPITNKNVYGQSKTEKKSLTIHSTGNAKSTAQNERDNLCRYDNTRKASFHWVVDEKQAIQCLDESFVAWHAGCKQGNNDSIGLEICESGNREKTLDNAAWLAANILFKHGWALDKMVRHYDWTGKKCPQIMANDGWAVWWEFRRNVKNYLDQMKGFKPVEGNEVKRYDKLEKIPAGEMRDTVKMLIDNGVISGKMYGLDLSEDMVRMLVYNKRAGLYDKYK